MGQPQGVFRLLTGGDIGDEGKGAYQTAGAIIDGGGVELGDDHPAPSLIFNAAGWPRNCAAPATRWCDMVLDGRMAGMAGRINGIEQEMAQNVPQLTAQQLT